MSSRSDSTSEPAWLLRDGHVLAAVELATTRRARRRGLLGRDSVGGALLLRPARAVHSIGMRFPIDVAFCDGDLVVLDLCHLVPGRVTRTRWRSRAVIEAQSGAFERWGLQVGDQLELRA